ncbi:uncharacterized protein PV07_07483 [Cladophialophora immunda]|uniref:Uncharacterized protein n=1 Tax=Cladophialophora immunda TaxID=569365 RepID=A0A0D2CBJ4_9EURO|nr:uncharacterized protein PV07_07483 [Cladophialophora immunda]KIW27775.1 hypothetical protein PV07_07483 [Cladophialophora immunda]OQV02915.1 hypothetical protein CLAIMM_08030 [Cladophialophora immunda]
MATKLKREHSYVPDEPSKRLAVPSKPETSPEVVLQHLSFSDLKEVVQTLLAHPATCTFTQSQLLAYQERAFDYSFNEAYEERCSIMLGASVARASAIKSAYANKGSQSLVLWPESMKPFLPRIQALIDKGTEVTGPVLAWDALKRATRMSIFEWYDDSDEITLNDEESCDWYHDEVDGLMLQIFRIQQQHDPEWLREEDPTKKIRKWQFLAKTIDGPCKYRYHRTLAFLGAFLPTTEA